MPSCIGVSILSFSKLHMFEFYYGVQEPTLKSLQTHYIDTDSFIVTLEVALIVSTSTKVIWISSNILIKM